MSEVSEQITFLYTADLQRSAWFYETVLALPLIVDQGSCRIYGVVGRAAYLGICERMSDNAAGLIFTFVTQDVDDWYARIQAHGYTCEHAPKISEEYGIYHFFVKDPSGHLLEFQSFHDPEWNTSG